MQERSILHSDANCFYASVEMLLNPDLRGKAVAVCGSTEERHGIVLAKSELAKKSGVKTGMANWEARQACPGLIVVPPQYDQYCKFSKLLRNIYLRYTDLVEPYGMDECWLDVTHSRLIHGDGIKIAEEIRSTVKEELGLTVSIGASFNKIFAKLGSDMKKPDAITVLPQNDWQSRIWPLPVSELLFVGRATTRKLVSRNVLTIGDLARTDPEILHQACADGFVDGIIDVGSGVIDAAADRTVVLKDAEARVKMWFDRSRARLERHDNKAAALSAVADASEPASEAVEDASEAPATEVIPEEPVTQPVEPGVPVAQLHRRLELIKSRH